MNFENLLTSELAKSIDKIIIDTIIKNKIVNRADKIRSILDRISRS